MNLIRKGQNYTHRGVIGVEAGIVMIAFVIVGAALAIVVLNMGLSTTQKAKTTINSGLGEASSTMEIDGTVVGIACHDNQCGASPVMNATGIPITITSGGKDVNLDPELTAVKLVLNAVEYTDIYSGVVTGAGTSASSIEEGFDNGITAGYLATNPVDGLPDQTNTVAFIYFVVSNGDPDKILAIGEHAVLAVAFEAAERPAALDTMKIEIVLATGATLTIERDIPGLSTTMINLG